MNILNITFLYFYQDTPAKNYPLSAPAVGFRYPLIASVMAMAQVPKSADVFGFEPGADYKLVIRRASGESGKRQCCVGWF